MQGSEAFIKIIKEHLESVAAADPLFAETFKKPNKNIKDCVTYILTTVQKGGKNGLADEEVFGMAIHYYDEDNIEVGTAKNTRVVVNRSLEGSSPAVKQAEPKPVKPKVTKKQPSADQVNIFG